MLGIITAERVRQLLHYVPPRSFLGEAAMRKEHKIHEMMERTTAAMFDARFNAVYHALHLAYESVKKLADEVLPDEEEQ